MRFGGMLMWAVLALTGAVVLAWFSGANVPVVAKLTYSELGQVVFLLIILAWVLSALAGGMVRPFQLIRAVLFWSLLGAVMIGTYAYRHELTAVGGRILGALAPGLPITVASQGSPGGDAVVITRASDRHFAVRGGVDGEPIIFLVDTGASFVTLTAREAAGLGINPRNLTFDMPIRTANGMIRAAPITLDSVTVGSIERNQVRALVAPPGTLSQSLLGLTFLDSLSSYTVSGDRLILSP